MKNLKNLRKRGLSLLLALVMCVSLLNLTAFAEDESRTLTCGKEEHSHSIEGGCYEPTCGKTEGEGAVEGAACTHEHGEDCGYKEAVEGVPCEHVHDEACSYAEAKEEVSCDCSETGEDGEIVHGEDCTYEAAVEGAACTHEHDEDCGYKEAVEGVPCGHIHSDDCGYVEAVEGHAHTSECYGEEAICDKAEHTHTEACYASEEPEQTCAFTMEKIAEEPEQTGVFTMEKIADGEYKITGEGVFAGKFIYNGETSTWNSHSLGYMAIKKLILDEGITAIAEGTFVDGWVSRSMKEIVLPTTLTTIGARAFRDGYLEKINLDYVTSVGAEAFYSNGNQNFASTFGNGITELTIPAGMTEIGEKAFYQMMGLKALTIEEGVTSIGANAFEGCRALETVVLPQSLETIGSEAFSGCNALTTISMTGEEATEGTAHIANVTTIGVGALNGVNMTELVLEDIGTIGNGSNSVTMSCPSLTSLTLNNVDTVKDYAFYWTPALAKVTMNDVGSVGMGAFCKDANLKEVSLTNVRKIGDQAFYGYSDLGYGQLQKVIIDGTDTIGTMAFAYNSSLNELSLDNIGTIGQQAFYYCPTLPTIAMGTVGTINQYAFNSCTGLTSIDSLENVGRIDGFAFYGCSKLTGLTVEDATKMGFNGNYSDVMARVEEILNGKFTLDAAPGIVKLAPAEGWEDSKAAPEDGSWNSYNGATQLVEQARWTNDGKTEAEVKVDAYYTANKQMDYIFVADLSASMAQLGNAGDQNARFYDMQSKLLDMTSQLLGSEGYDCRVAIVTFGGALTATTPGTSKTLGFTSDADAAMAHINGLEPLYENTDYGLGMQEALKLVQANTGRNTVVVFLSDGQPYTPDGVTPTSNELNGTTSAAAIRALNVPIYGVLHSPGAAHDVALAAMKAVCGENTVYESTDTESFGKAMNKAFTAVYGTYTVTILVNEAFENVHDLTVSASAGEAVLIADGKTITWTITGMPFTKHTLTYKMSLTPENAARYDKRNYDVNDGDAVIIKDDTQVKTSVETPVLERTTSAPVTPKAVRYIVQYLDENGNELKAADMSRGGKIGETVSVTDTDKGDIAKDGKTYKFDDGNQANNLSGTLKKIEGDGDIVILKLYFVTEKVTVTWKDGHTETPLKVKTDHEKGTEVPRSEYPGDPTRTGYTFTGWGTPVLDADGNITITAQWRSNGGGGGRPTPPPTHDDPTPDDPPPTDIPNEDPPLTDIPDEDPPLTDIPEEEPPLTDIPEEEPPLADVPQTGDSSGIWSIIALTSGAGLAWLILEEKKRKGTAE